MIELLIELSIVFILGIIVGYHYIINMSYVYHAPSSNSVRRKLFYDSDTNMCYKLVPKVFICPIKYSMIKKNSKNN